MEMTTIVRRTYVELDYTQGEDVRLEFKVEDDCEVLLLSDYTLTGNLIEKFNDVPVASFVFTESDDPEWWIASIDKSITENLAVQKYTFEIKLEDPDGYKETLLYGDLDLRKGLV